MRDGGVGGGNLPQKVYGIAYEWGRWKDVVFWETGYRGNRSENLKVFERNCPMLLYKAMLGGVFLRGHYNFKLLIKKRSNYLLTRKSPKV